MVTENNIWQDDYLDRSASSKFLTSYILANPHIKVVNVNSPWGSGKTFFLTRWAQELSENHVCVFFDAWANDFSNEPLVALITCIEQQTRDTTALESSPTGQAIISATSNLIKKATPLITKGLVRKFLGVEINEIFGDAAAEDTSKAAESLVEKLIEEQSKVSDNILNFKKAVLEKLEQAALNSSKKKPAFIFIDELDRCRPTYAIELLERIKHFFELEDCRFIVASDSTQLAHSIRAIYGEQFYSESYLSRFFDAEFRLDNRDPFKIISEHTYDTDSVKLGINISGEIQSRYYPSKDPVYPATHTVTCKIEGYTENALIAAALSKAFDLSLRDTIKCLKQIKSACDFLNDKNLNFFWLAFLIISKCASETVYQSIWAAEKPIGRIRDAFSNHNNVSFSFTFANTHILEIIEFYISIIRGDETTRRQMSNGLDGWKSNIYYSVINDLRPLLSYRDVVELAHKIS
jgi:hypothetical protein